MNLVVVEVNKHVEHDDESTERGGDSSRRTQVHYFYQVLVDKLEKYYDK